MRIFLLIIIYLMGSVWSLNAQHVNPNPESVILTFDMRGGQKPRKSDGPILQIYADGRVIARALKPGEPPVNKLLSEVEKAALFAELIVEKGILNLTTASIEDEIAKQNIKIRGFPDAPETFLSIDLPKGSTSISIKGVSAMVYVLPKAESLQKLFSIQRRLINFAKQVNDESSRGVLDK